MPNLSNAAPLPPDGFIPLGEHLAATGQVEGTSVPPFPARFEPVTSYARIPPPPCHEPLPTPQSLTWAPCTLSILSAVAGTQQ